MKRREIRTHALEPGQVVHAAALESELFAKLHPLVAHCAVTRYEDGAPRKGGWFTVRCVGSLWTVTLKDPDAGAQLIATGATVDDALVLASMLLEAPDAPWEIDPFLLPAGAKRGGRKSG